MGEIYEIDLKVLDDAIELVRRYCEECGIEELDDTIRRDCEAVMTKSASAEEIAHTVINLVYQEER